ncbi:MAG: hypothetical protein V4568_01730 [Pseudomonadota bacterium]
MVALQSNTPFEKGRANNVGFSRKHRGAPLSISLGFMSPPTYLHLAPMGAVLPDISTLAPFRAVIVAEAEVSPDWQASVSVWLVQSGCLYTMAWGTNCSSWDDSVDMANIEEFNFKEIPENKFVMTTWHEDETMAEVFWFCKNNAFHPNVELTQTLVLHISANEREQEIVKFYAKA